MQILLCVLSTKLAMGPLWNFHTDMAPLSIPHVLSLTDMHQVTLVKQLYFEASRVENVQEHSWCVVTAHIQACVGFCRPWLLLCSNFTMCCAHVPVHPVNHIFVSLSSILDSSCSISPWDQNLVCLSMWLKSLSLYSTVALTNEKWYNKMWSNSSLFGQLCPGSLWLCRQGGQWDSPVCALGYLSSPQVWAELARERHRRQKWLQLSVTAAEQNEAWKFHSQFP